MFTSESGRCPICHSLWNMHEEGELEKCRTERAGHMFALTRQKSSGCVMKFHRQDGAELSVAFEPIGPDNTHHDRVNIALYPKGDRRARFYKDTSNPLEFLEELKKFYEVK